MIRRIAWAFATCVSVIAALLLWQRERLVRLGTVVTLFDEDRIVANFSAMGRVFDTAALPVSTRPAPFATGPALQLPPDWQAWRTRRAITGALVLKHGTVAHESYHLGTGPDDLRISWSLAKSYLSALFGVILAEGKIGSIEDPVDLYAPELAGSAYAGVSIRNVLRMSSGVAFDEDYLSFWSDINRMGRVLALGGSMDAFALARDARTGPPGEVWRYVSIDTHVLALVLRRATGETLPDLLADRILEPMGVLGAPFYLTDGHGTAFALGGLNMTLRDYARLGELFRMHGMMGDTRIVPEAWVAESTRPQAVTAPGDLAYGYQWWIASDAPEGEFFARGIYGQYIYVNRAEGAVVALAAADRSFREPGAFADALGMMRRLARSGRRE